MPGQMKERYNASFSMIAIHTTVNKHKKYTDVATCNMHIGSQSELSPL